MGSCKDKRCMEGPVRSSYGWPGHVYSGAAHILGHRSLVEVNSSNYKPCRNSEAWSNSEN